METFIDWDFAPERNKKGNHEYTLSIYWNPIKKSPTYTIQLHKNAPERLLNAEVVSFGKLQDSIVVSDSDKGNSYNVNPKKGQCGAQINGKELTKKIVSFYGYDTNENHKIRFKLNPIGSPKLRLWELELHK